MKPEAVLEIQLRAILILVAHQLKHIRHVKNKNKNIKKIIISPIIA
jgi:hypothetical protein